MDDQYKALHQQAMMLQNKFHDFTGDVNHPDVSLMRNEIMQLDNDIKSQKNIHTIEDRVKTIQRQILQSEHSGSPVMQYEHKDYLHDNYEQLRQSLHQFDHY